MQLLEFGIRLFRRLLRTTVVIARLRAKQKYIAANSTRNSLIYYLPNIITFFKTRIVFTVLHEKQLLNKQSMRGCNRRHPIQYGKRNWAGIYTACFPKVQLGKTTWIINVKSDMTFGAISS